MNLVINGRRLEDGFPCYICGEPMVPEQMERRMDHNPYYECGMLHYDPVTMGCSIDFRCLCGTRLTIDVPQYRLASVSKVETEPELSFWEYIVMGVKSVRYGRVHNTGNYENERMEVEVELEPGQSVEDAVIEARRVCNKHLGIGPTSEDVEAARNLLKEAGEL